MERTLVLSVFGVGWLGWVFGLLGTWSGRGTEATGREAIPRGLLAACILTPLFVFLATLPEHGAFASGQGFGRGFVIGAVGALLADWPLLRIQATGSARGDSLQSAAATTAPYFMAAVATALSLLWLHSVLTDALLGVAIGWFVNSFFLILAPNKDGRVAALTISAGFAVTLAISVALGDYRGGVRFAAGATPVSWRAIVLVFGGSIPFLMLLCALPAAWIVGVLSRLPLAGLAVRLGEAATRGETARRTLARIWRLLPAGALLLVVARLLAVRLEDHPPLLTLTAIGLVATTLAWWLTDRDVGTTEGAGATSARQQNSALAVFVMLCATMAAYQMFEGVGIAAVLLTGWSVAGLLQHGGMEPTAAEAVELRPDGAVAEAMNYLPSLLIFGLLVEIYRLVTIRYSLDLHGVTLADHYALFGFVLGAIVPSALASYVAIEGRHSDLNSGEAIIRAILVGALVLAVPFTVLLLFGAKCELAILFGLAVGAVLPLVQRGAMAAGNTVAQGGAHAQLSALLPSLLALAMGLALAQWTHHVLPLALYARARKLRLIAYVVGALIGMLLPADIYERFRGGRSSGKDGVGAQDVAGRAAR